MGGVVNPVKAGYLYWAFFIRKKQQNVLVIKINLYICRMKMSVTHTQRLQEPKLILGGIGV